MDRKRFLRKKRLLNNPAVLRLLYLLDKTNYTISIGSYVGKIMGIFAIGTSGAPGSRDIDLDIVFDVCDIAHLDEFTRLLSTQLEMLAKEANDFSLAISRSETHVPLVLWPIFKEQFNNPRLFRSQLPADFLRCDGGGGIANMIFLNEFIQTGVTIWSASEGGFRIEEVRRNNPISEIPIDEAIEYFAISTRDLAKAYLLQDASARDYLLSKAILRATYAYCVSCSLDRIDSYDDIPNKFISHVIFQSGLAESISEKIGRNHIISRTIRARTSFLQSYQSLIVQAARVRKRSIERFQQNITIRTYLLFEEFRQFIELTYFLTGRSEGSVDLVANYQKRTIPELISLMLSSDVYATSPIVGYFIQELGLVDSEASMIRSYTSKILDSQYLDRRGLNDNEKALAIKYSIYWRDEIQELQGGPQHAVHSQFFDTKKRLTTWYENTMTGFLIDGEAVKALQFQFEIDRSWLGEPIFTSRNKYVFAKCLNVDWTIDAIYYYSTQSEIKEASQMILHIFKDGIINSGKREGGVVNKEKERELSLEDSIKICMTLLEEYGLWPDRYATFLTDPSSPSIYTIGSEETSVDANDLFVSSHSHRLISQIHLATRLAGLYFERAQELVCNNCPSEALENLQKVLSCKPNWAHAHALAAFCHMVLHDKDRMFIQATKAVLSDPSVIPFDVVEKASFSDDSFQEVAEWLDQNPIQKKAALLELLKKSIEEVILFDKFLSDDGLIDLALNPHDRTEYKPLDNPVLREILYSSIELVEIGDIIKSTAQLPLEGQRLPSLDSRISDLQDFANWTAFTCGREIDKGFPEEVTPHALSAVEGEKNRADTLLRNGDFRGVVAILARMEKFHLLLPRDYLALGQALCGLGLLADAEKALTKGYQLTGDIKVLRSIAELQIRKGNLDYAMELCQQALERNPDYCNLHLTISDIYKLRSDSRMRFRYLMSASLCSDMEFSLHETIIDDLTGMGCLLEACIVCLRMLNRGGYYERLKARFLVLIKRLKVNCEKEIGLTLDPQINAVWNNSSELIRIGSVFDDNEQYDKAIICYKRVIELGHMSAAAYYNLGNTYRDMGNHEKEMLETYHKAVELCPQDATIISGLASAYKKTGKYQKAIDYYKKALDLNPQCFSSWTMMGNCFIELSDNKQALYCHQKAKEIAPHERLGILNLALTQLCLEEWRRAIETSLEGLEKWENDKQFRAVCTTALLKGSIAFKEYPRFAPHLSTALDVALKMKWIDAGQYAEEILWVLAVLAAACSDPGHADAKGFDSILPTLGFNLAFCERKMINPLFDHLFLQRSLWDPDELLEKLSIQNENLVSIDTINRLNEFIDEQAHDSFQRSHAIGALLQGYKLFNICFPEH
jgi:tetratricopeptide (TPR) repeat protein